ncbi:Casanova [Mortierella antarctica]|nr:Casanova [Mortierella antarctica]
MSDAKPKTSSSPDAPVAKKVPRPSNSFLIYRKEHAKKYAGLVATELSTKLAMAWKNETPERQAYYAKLAALAKQEHALKFPDYKFTPVKRGTGKRALQLAAKANTSRAASGASGASSIQNKAVAPRKKANTLRSPLPMPEMSAPVLASTRSGRQVSKPQRYTPSVAYPSKRNIYSRYSTIPPAYSSSLFFSPSPYESYSLEAPMVPNSCSSPSSTISAQVNHHSSLKSGSDLSDPEDGEDDDYPGSDCHTDRVLLHMGQQPGMTSPARSWVFDNTSPVANQAVFEPLAMEAFEPECLAHHHDPSSSSSSSSSSLWSTPEGSPTAVMMRQLYEQYQQQQQHVLPTHHYPYHHQHYQNPVHQYVQPVYVEPSPLYPSFNNINININNNNNNNNNTARHLSLDGTLPVLPSQQGGPTDPAIQFSIEMDKLQRDLTSLLPSPVSTPLRHPSMMALPSSSEISSSCVTEGASYSFVPPVMLVQEDIMMSPALSTCSSVSSGAQDAQSYFARALELL